MLALFFKKTDIFWIVAVALSGFFGGKLITLFSREEEGRLPGNFDIARRAPAFDRVLLSDSSSKSMELYYRKEEKKNLKELDFIAQKLMEGYIPENWEAELKKMVNLSYPSRLGHSSFFTFFVKWAEVDFLQAMKYVQRAPSIPGLPEYMIRQFAERTASKSPREALQYYQDHKKVLGMNGSILMGVALDHWAAKDPEGLLDWCLCTDGSRYGDYVMESAMSRALPLVGFSSAKARAVMDAYYAETGNLPGEIFRAWAEADPEAALEWAGRRETEEKTAEYQMYFFSGIVNRDYEKVRNWILEMPEKEREKVVLNMCSHIKAPEQKLDLLFQTMPAQEVPHLAHVIDWWVYDNPDKTEEWINRLPASSEKDVLTSLYAENGLYKQPYIKALDMLNGMQDQDRKNEALKTLLQKWDRDNSAGLHKWLESSGHSELLSLLKEGEKGK